MVKIIESNWEKVFTKDINDKLEHADKEYNKYKETGYIIYMQQASNKLFSAVENYMMLKYNKRVKSYRQLVIMIKHNRNDSILMAQVVQLHYFFYNGELQMTKDEAELLYIDIRKKIKVRLNKLL